MTAFGQRGRTVPPRERREIPPHQRGLGRYHAGAANRCELLHGPRPAQAGGTREARVGQAGAWHACRRLYQDAGANSAVLSYQALAGPGGARVQGTLNAAELPDLNGDRALDHCLNALLGTPVPGFPRFAV